MNLVQRTNAEGPNFLFVRIPFRYDIFVRTVAKQ